MHGSFVFLIGLLLVANTAQAWDRDAAAYVRRGQELFSQGFYAEAADQFRDAYAIDPDPNQLYNEARCHEELNELPRALSLYERYFRQKPDASNSDQVEDSIRQLSWTLSRTMKRMEIRSIPPAAVLFLDDQEVPLGKTPLRVWMDYGDHRVRLSLAGYPVQEQSFSATKEGQDWFAVALVQESEPVAAPGIEPEPVPVPEIESVPTPVSEIEPVPEPKGFRYPASAVVTTVLTLGAVAGGVTMHVRAQGNDAKSYRMWGNLGFGVAAAGALSTAILLIVANGGDDSGAPPLVLSPVPGGVSALWSGVF